MTRCGPPSSVWKASVFLIKIVFFGRHHIFLEKKARVHDWFAYFSRKKLGCIGWFAYFSRKRLGCMAGLLYNTIYTTTLRHNRRMGARI